MHEDSKNMKDNNKRIVKNSVLMFIRMGLLMLINLIAVRFIRSGLGVESYGILNAVIGVVHILTFLSVVLSASSQRFLSIALGENNPIKQNEIFSTSFRISLYFIMIMIVVFETIGLWFVSKQMNYPVSEFNNVMWIYQFSIFTFANTIFQVPFLAAILAHEDIHIFAFSTLFEAIIKLIIALGIPFFSSNPLVIYVGLLLVISIIPTCIYICYANKRYAECRTFTRTNQHLRPMLSFSTWTMFGALAGSALIQGNTLLINIYNGPISNAAFAIAVQIYIAVSQLGNNVFIAIRSRMIQSYANKEYDYLNQLFTMSEKALLWLLPIICVPLFVWMPEILHLWLGDVDSETINCSRGMLLTACILILNNPITIIIQATGCVKQYHLLIEPIILLSIPASWLLLSAGFSAVYTCYAICFFCIIAHFVRLERLKRYYPFISYLAMLKQLLLPIGYSKEERLFIKSLFNKR